MRVVSAGRHSSVGHKGLAETPETLVSPLITELQFQLNAYCRVIPQISLR